MSRTRTRRNTRETLLRKKQTAACQPFQSYAAHFLQQKALTCSEYTLHSYRLTLNTACRYLGDLPLERIDTIALDRMIRAMTQGEKPYSAATIRHVHTLVRMVLGMAVREGILAVNAADHAHYEPPRMKKKEPVFLEPEEARRYIACALREPDLRIRCAVLLLLYTGIRREELCGLQWEDIDFEKREIFIRRATVYVSGTGIITKPPKNESSIRILQADPIVFLALKELRRSREQQKEKAGRLFVRRDGSPIHPDAVGIWLKRFAKRYGLRPVTPHKLRHTYATLQIFYGTDIRTVAGCMGHSTPATTLNIYSHQVKSSARKASDAMSAILTPDPKEIDGKNSARATAGVSFLSVWVKEKFKRGML